jgi:hypothetical protein
VNALEAEEVLHIQSGERPPIAPAPTSPYRTSSRGGSLSAWLIR